MRLSTCPPSPPFPQVLRLQVLLPLSLWHLAVGLPESRGRGEDLSAGGLFGVIPGTRAGETASAQVLHGSLRVSSSGQCSRGVCLQTGGWVHTPWWGPSWAWWQGGRDAVRVKRVRARSERVAAAAAEMGEQGCEAALRAPVPAATLWVLYVDLGPSFCADLTSL